jgi:hypothetical protein
LSLVALLQDAADSGVRISLRGSNLALKAAVKPPPELLASLRTHKAEIVALLRKGMCAAPAEPVSPRPEGSSADDARASVERLLDAMAAENERRRDWWRKPIEGWSEGRLTIRSIVTGESTVIRFPKGGRR